MKIYTKVGDKGSTKQISGKKVPKYDPQIETLGNFDELDSWLGFVVSLAHGKAQFSEIEEDLIERQHDLHSLMADIAQSTQQRITPEMVHYLEEKIDEMMDIVPPVTSFILPGGQQVAAALQYARTLARRAERSLDKLNDDGGQQLPADVLQYANRLSDYLYALALYANHKGDTKEIKTRPKDSH